MKLHVLLVPGLLFTQVACFLDFGHRSPPPDPGPAPRWGSAPAPTATARPAPVPVGQPHITSIDVPEWPPLGRSSVVTVSCSSPNGPGALRAAFARQTSRVVGTSSSITFNGADLGEGFGTLTLELTDPLGAGAQRTVENLLVDLSDPGVELETDVVRPTGELVLSVYDAWVLGEVEVTVDGKTSSHAFPKVYPGTLGRDFDQSRVTIPLLGVSVGAQSAVVVVRDAAGNTTTKSFDVFVDGTPPAVSFSSPAAGATVGTSFDVAFTASDDGATGPVVELLVGGGYAGTMTGTSGKLTVDTTGYGKGELKLDLVAIDKAGNRTIATRSVVLP